MKVQFLCFLVLILVSTALSQPPNKCPFDYLYHFGDGVTDVGNSVLSPPNGPSNAATRPPYGMSVPPRTPNGRWSDGYIDFDFASWDFGFDHITPYLAWNTSSGNGVIFSVARSPVLDHKFFRSRGIKIPSYAVSLNGQLKWFRTYLKSVCSTRKECAAILGNSLVLFGDIEGNDIGYALTQGKTINEVKQYAPLITQTQIDAARELIEIGATRIVIPGNSPLGCFPYVLTALGTNEPSDYDELGCLKSVNDLVNYKNDGLQNAIKNLSAEFPDISIYYGDFGAGVIDYINQTLAGPNKDIALKACCGTGGKYNFNSKRFCGSRGVPVCSNPEDYVFWDGLHLSHTASFRIEQVLVQPALVTFNCTTAGSSASM